MAPHPGAGTQGPQSSRVLPLGLSSRKPEHQQGGQSRPQGRGAHASRSRDWDNTRDRPASKRPAGGTERPSGGPRGPSSGEPRPLARPSIQVPVAPSRCRHHPRPRSNTDRSADIPPANAGTRQGLRPPRDVSSGRGRRRPPLPEQVTLSPKPKGGTARCSVIKGLETCSSRHTRHPFPDLGVARGFAESRHSELLGADPRGDIFISRFHSIKLHAPSPDQ